MFILGKWVIYYTKETFKTLKYILIGTGIICTVVFIKYQPVYEVTLSGSLLGYVESKENIENEINEFMRDTSDNVAYREIATLPEYDYKLLSRDKVTKEEDVIASIESTVKTTYRMYAVTSDGEQKAILKSEEDAQNLINQIQEGTDESIDLNLGIAEVYTETNEITSSEEATNALNECKAIKVAQYEEEQKAKVVEAAKTTKYASAVSQSTAIASTTQAAASGSLAGLSLSIPVSGTISSRFGARSSSRSSAHTGLDISAPSGTGIRPITSGTVTFASYNGSYGNLIIVDHGNGIQSYYAHCSAIYVSVGQSVDTSITIGAVGSTGNSTGPHLHLEIRIDGTPVNPQNYLY